MYCLMAVQAAWAADVDIGLKQFGVASRVRPGDICGIEVELLSNLPADQPKRVWVQWEVPDADGDQAECGREITLTSGRPTPLWLYARLPGPQSFNEETVTLIRVFELDGRLDETGSPERGRELGAARYSPANARAGLIRLDHNMMLHVGNRPIGLGDFEVPMAAGNSLAANEFTHIAGGVQLDELPDRWYPLDSFDAIVIGPDVLPQQLRIDAARALVDYVERGGHLVIVLSESGEPWGIGSGGSTIQSAELASLLPSKAPRKDEATALELLLPILSKSRYLPPLPSGRSAPYEMAVRIFKEIAVKDEDADSSPPESGELFDGMDPAYQPLMALPDGRVIVVQRLHGHGRITISGLDVGYGTLRAVELPHADVFWNPILGRRADTVRAGELNEIDSADYLNKYDSKIHTLGSGRLFEDQINLTGQASIGLLLTFGMFVGYLVIAWMSFFALRQYSMQKHAWMAFVVTAAVFTAAAWGTVRVAQDRQARVEHVSFVDDVSEGPNPAPSAEQRFPRVVSWFNVYLPGYGQRRIGFDSMEDQRDFLTAWSTPDAPIRRFPNVDRYDIDVADHFGEYDVPARATAKQFHANYLGPLDEPWSGLFRVDPANPIRCDPATRQMTGTIISELPARPSEMYVILNTGIPKPVRRLYAEETDDKEPPKKFEMPWTLHLRSGMMTHLGYMYTKSGVAIAPGDRLNLAELQRSSPLAVAELESTIDKTFVEEFRPSQYSSMLPDAGLSAQKARLVLQMYGIFHQLTPPTYLTRPRAQPQYNVRFMREVGRELDLSEWFTRPCLIVIGRIDDQPMPAPLRLGSRDEPLPCHKSITIFRWICPIDLEDETVIVPDAGGKN